MQYINNRRIFLRNDIKFPAVFLKRLPSKSALDLTSHECTSAPGPCCIKGKYKRQTYLSQCCCNSDIRRCVNRYSIDLFEDPTAAFDKDEFLRCVDTVKVNMCQCTPRRQQRGRRCIPPLILNVGTR